MIAYGGRERNTTMTDAVGPEFFDLQEILAGRYSLERELGRGGMGVVLLARDVALDRLVAIKLLPAHLASHSGLRERFLQEARTAAGLSHPHIVPIHAVEEHGDLVFFVMGYVDGETLRDRVERVGPLSPRAAMKLLQEVSWALSYAHEHGVVHRDVKPENIMIERATERALVTDFGIARVGDSEESTPKGQVVGTARYMSPEQAAGEEVDARGDIYSLGATAFFALTGRPPFDAPNVPALLAKHVTEPAPRLAVARREVPDKLAAVVDRCLEKSPDDRFVTAGDLADAIGLVRGRELRAPPLVRSFLRNAEVSTAVLATAAVVAQGPADEGAVLFVMILTVAQLGSVARRLLRTGYTFPDIREALLAEARVQQEEMEATKEGKFWRRVFSFWNRLWAGWFGRKFFKIAGFGIKPPKRAALPSADATEIVLGRAATDVFNSLPHDVRTQFPEAPAVIEGLEHRAEALRRGGTAGAALTDTVAALENVRLVLLRFQAGEVSARDLTLQLERAAAIGGHVDAQIAGRQEVEELLKP
jgi:serine/threonine-protein kinase